MLLRRHKNRLQQPKDVEEFQEVEQKEEVVEKAINLSELGIKELRDLGKEYKVKNYNQMKKADLIEELTKILD